MYRNNKTNKMSHFLQANITAYYQLTQQTNSNIKKERTVVIHQFMMRHC